MLSVSFGSDPGYLTRHVEEHRDPERDRNYYLSATEHGEPPGRWFGKGAQDLGLSGEVDNDKFLALYQRFAHPATGERLGSRPYQFKDTPERVAEAIETEGEVTPERRQEIELEVRKSHREARNYVDATFSPPKSWSVLHAALESQGRHGEAEELWAAWMDGVEAGIDYLQEDAGYSRAGRHGAKVAGTTTGRWIEAPDWVMSAWRHHTSRDGDPQLHVHVAILNRVRCSDGQWRALDGQAILRARPAAGAIAERVAEESASRRLGISFAMRPDGKAREIVGIDEPIRDAFSSRRQAIKAEVAELARAYEEARGQAPDALALWAMYQHATVETRKPKPIYPPSPAQRYGAYERTAKALLGGGMARLVWQSRAGEGREPVAEAFDPARVIDQAIWEVQHAKAAWRRQDLIAELNRQLPDCLGGLPRHQLKALLNELADQALSPGAEVVRLAGPDLVPAPPELRFANGRSIYEPQNADRFATTWHLRLEEAVVEAARSHHGPKVEPEVAEALVAKSGLSPNQGQAVTKLLTSGRVVEAMVGYAGVGKSFTTARLAEAWTEATGRAAVGLTTAEKARQVLGAEGFAQSANIARWLAVQERIAGGRASRQDEAYRLVAGQLIVVDEASMVTTADMAAIASYARRAGAKVVLSGDDAQLGAVGAGGLFGYITQEIEPVRLDEVRRFSHVWEQEASKRLRAGDASVLAEYDRRGRIHEGSRDEMIAEAKEAIVASHLRGESALLVTATNEMAAELASEVRTELVGLGQVEDGGVVLRDGNRAGVGDVIMTRENNYSILDDAGNPVVNRYLYVVTERRPDGSLVGRLISGTGAGIGKHHDLPARYVAESVELGYASTAHSAQGATVKVGAVLVDEHLSRESLYVGVTRGYERNAMFVVTHDPATPAHTEGDARHREAPDVLIEVMERRSAEPAASEVLRDETLAGESLARLEPKWADLVESHYRVEARAQLLAAVGHDTARELAADEKSLAELTGLIRQAEVAGLDRSALIETVTNGQLGTARDLGDVLSWRIRNQIGKAEPIKLSYASRTPEGTNPRARWAGELAEAMDRRVSELGERAAAEQPGWAKALGPVPAKADNALEWSERAGAIAAYREAHGYHAPDDPIGPAPERRNVEARAAWHRAYEALGRPPEQRELAGASDAELTSVIEAYHREEAWAPPNVDQDMKDKGLALEHWRNTAELEQAKAAHEGREIDPAQRHANRAMMYELEADVAALSEISTARHAWHEETQKLRQREAAARRELAVRGVEAPERDGQQVPEDQDPKLPGQPEPERDQARQGLDIEEGLAKARAAMTEIEARRQTERVEREQARERSDYQYVRDIDEANREHETRDRW